MGRPIEDALLIARGLKEEDKASRAGKASGKARSGVDSKEAFILAEAARYRGSPEAMVNTIVKRYAAFTKHKKSVSARHVRNVLSKK